eukprot:gene19150-22895_t
MSDVPAMKEHAECADILVESLGTLLGNTASPRISDDGIPLLGVSHLLESESRWSVASNEGPRLAPLAVHLRYEQTDRTPPPPRINTLLTDGSHDTAHAPNPSKFIINHSTTSTASPGSPGGPNKEEPLSAALPVFLGRSNSQKLRRNSSKLTFAERIGGSLRLNRLRRSARVETDSHRGILVRDKSLSKFSRTKRPLKKVRFLLATDSKSSFWRNTWAWPLIALLPDAEFVIAKAYTAMLLYELWAFPFRFALGNGAELSAGAKGGLLFIADVTVDSLHVLHLVWEWNSESVTLYDKLLGTAGERAANESLEEFHKQFRKQTLVTRVAFVMHTVFASKGKALVYELIAISA